MLQKPRLERSGHNAHPGFAKTLTWETLTWEAPKKGWIDGLTEYVRFRLLRPSVALKPRPKPPNKSRTRTCTRVVRASERAPLIPTVRFDFDFDFDFDARYQERGSETKAQY